MVRRSRCQSAMRAGAPIRFRPRRWRFEHLSELRGVRRAAVRARSDGADRLRSQRAAASRHASWHPERRPVNALETLNIRARAICHLQGRFRPGDRPVRCRQEPPRSAKSFASTRRARACGRTGSADGTKPDLDKLPMYCAVFSFKNWYDAKDMRGTAERASISRWTSQRGLADMRAAEEGAIIYAVATAYNVGGASGSRTGEGKNGDAVRQPEIRAVGWPGLQPYDTQRSRAARAAARASRCRRIS